MIPPGLQPRPACLWTTSRRAESGVLMPAIACSGGGLGSNLAT